MTIDDDARPAQIMVIYGTGRKRSNSPLWCWPPHESMRIQANRGIHGPASADARSCQRGVQNRTGAQPESASPRSTRTSSEGIFPVTTRSIREILRWIEECGFPRSGI